jgi:hypothetical protein
MANNANGFAALDAQIAKIKELGKLPEQVAPKVAFAAKEELRKQVAAQRGPDGRPWPKSEDGKPVLVNAGENVRATAVGSVVVLTVEDHYARHHMGFVKGGKRRPILPTNKIPDPMTRAITRVVTGEFLAKMSK